MKAADMRGVPLLFGSPYFSQNYLMEVDEAPQDYRTIDTSTRRFSWRPAAVAFVAIGLVAPKLLTSI
jgi:hypothetical protein